MEDDGETGADASPKRNGSDEPQMAAGVTSVFFVDEVPRERESYGDYGMLNSPNHHSVSVCRVLTVPAA